MSAAGRSDVYSFFFQAEDGIRDKLVTGVQTCALPISHRHDAKARHGRAGGIRAVRGLRDEADVAVRAAAAFVVFADREQARSEERRVGKEGRSRWAPDH